MRTLATIALMSLTSTVMAQDFYDFSNNFYGQRGSTRMEFAPTSERLELEFRYQRMMHMFPPFTLWGPREWEEYDRKQEQKKIDRMIQYLKDLTLPPAEFKEKYLND